MMRETWHDDGDDKFVVRREQDVEPILNWNHEARAAGHNIKSDLRHLGRIPFVLAEQWSRECGAAIGTKEFAAYLKRKMLDGEFAKLRVWEGSY